MNTFFRLMPCSAKLRAVIIVIRLMSLAVESLRIELDLFCLLQRRVCGRCGVGNFFGPVNNPLRKFIRSASSVVNFNERVFYARYVLIICVGNLHDRGNACFGVAKFYFQICRLGSTYAEHPGFAQEYSEEWLPAHLFAYLSSFEVLPMFFLLSL